MKLHYGWVVTFVCFMVAFFAWGAVFWGHSFYISVLNEQHGWSRVSLSWAVTTFWIAGLPMTVVVGGMIDRYGSRKIMMAGAALTGICVALLGEVTELWQVFAVYIVMAWAYPAIGAVGISSTLVKWFSKDLSVAMSVALTGSSMGAVILVPAMSELEVAFDFQFAIRVIAGTILFVALPLIALFLKEPESHNPAPPEPLFPYIRTTFSNPAFRVIAWAAGLSLAAQVGYIMHQIPILEVHMGRELASTAVAFSALCGITGRFVVGYLSRTMDLRILAAFCYSMGASGYLILSFSDTTFMLFVGCGVAGVVVGSLLMIPPLLVRQWLGDSDYGKTYGLLALTIYIFQGLGPGAVGLVQEYAGGYPAALWMQVAIMSLAIFALTRLGPPPRGTGVD